MLIELDKICKKYDSPSSPGSQIVLKDVILKVEEGESIAVLGPSGSGKSTLLNIMGALDTPDSGSVIFDNRDISVLEERELARIRSRDIGFIFQLHHLLPQCSVLENVLLPTLANKSTKTPEAAHPRAIRLLEGVGLGGHLYHHPAQLSGGEQQRVAVVRALINQPKLLLADEPTGSLDQAATESLGRLLVELNREQGVTLVLVTHATDLAKKMDKIYRLKEGRLKLAT